jgi:ornithine cyclodeaminase
MLILSTNEIKNLFTMKDAIQASREALGMYSEGKSKVPLRINIDMPKKQGQSLFMPAYAEDLDAIGIKIVSVFPHNRDLNKPTVPAQMVLINGQTGEVCAILNGTYLTQMRTGALQGLATDLFARSDAKRAVLIGTGGQAATQLEAMLNVRKLQEVNVIDIDFNRAKQFASIMQETFSHFNASIIAVKDCDEAVKKADIITTVTTSKTPVFDGRLVKKGAHINGIGSYTSEMQELPESIICIADKIIFDTKEGVMHEAGDILIPMKAGVITEADIDGELGEVVLGKVKARETEEEITLFKAVGSALLDIVTAHKIYQKALEVGAGQCIDI